MDAGAVATDRLDGSDPVVVYNPVRIRGITTPVTYTIEVTSQTLLIDDRLTLVSFLVLGTRSGRQQSNQRDADCDCG